VVDFETKSSLRPAQTAFSVFRNHFFVILFAKNVIKKTQKFVIIGFDQKNGISYNFKHSTS